MFAISKDCDCAYTTNDARHICNSIRTAAGEDPIPYLYFMDFWHQIKDECVKIGRKKTFPFRSHARAGVNYLFTKEAAEEIGAEISMRQFNAHKRGRPRLRIAM